MREGSVAGAYMADDLLLYLLGQISELKTCSGRGSLGDDVRRHRAQLAGAAQKSAARSAVLGEEAVIL